MSDAFLHGAEVIEIDDGLRPIRAIATSVIGIVGTAPFADPTAFPLDTPVLITRPAQAAALMASYVPATHAASDVGSLPSAIADIHDQAQPPIVVVRVDVAAAGASQLANQLAEVRGVQAEASGVYALLAAKQLVKAQPRILIATGWTHQVPQAGDPLADVANPVAAALKVCADKLRAVAIVDGPNDTDADAIDKAEREGGQRVYFIDPHIKAADHKGMIVTRPASAAAAGVIARTDRERGFWWSPSNQTVNGVLGISRPIDFSLSDPATSSNLLNEAGVATIINEDGYRLWGNRTPGFDAAWTFLSVRRTADIIHDAVEKSYLWALDRPQSAQLLADVVDSVEAYLRDLKLRGAILGGKAWLDQELNTPASLKAGRAYVNFDFEPPPPLERLTFRAHREDAYFTELVTLVTGAN